MIKSAKINERFDFIFGIRGRFYGDGLEKVEERGLLYQYPLRIHALGRLRFARGKNSVVLSGGMGAAHQVVQMYENNLYLSEQSYTWSWITQLQAGGVRVYLEGVPENSLLIVGLGIDSLGFRGVF